MRHKWIIDKQRDSKAHYKYDKHHLCVRCGCKKLTSYGSSVYSRSGICIGSYAPDCFDMIEENLKTID